MNDPSTCYHRHPHPDVHCTAKPWAAGQTLHVAVAYTNPCRYQARRRLVNQFRRHMQPSANVRLYVGEAALGDRPFDVTDPANPDDHRFRTRHELWHKENLLNLVIQRFDPDWQYGAYVDGDFHFTRHDWALQAVHLLQTYDFVQLFSTYSDLSPEHGPLNVLPGFAYALRNNLDVTGKPISPASGYGRPGSPGGAWAFRRDAFDKVGGLLDTCILGSADWHMAVGLAQLEVDHPDTTRCGEPYRHSIRVWQERAKVINRNIGFVRCHAVHHWHGPKSRRGYSWRWQILRDHAFDPYADIYRDSQGLWQLTPAKPRLRDDIRAYFASRSEDDITHPKHLV
jgi:hypothetical protein